MKLGILTFHSQQNYGGVLQCFAMKSALELLGHEVVVIDRWLNESNGALCGEFVQLDIKGWVKLLIRSFAGCGDFGCLLRTIRSIRFVKRLGLTKYHFYDWKDAPKDLGVDLLVVGSDQVWHCGDWGNPAPYLLEGAPKIKAISYAASFGMKEIPNEYAELYKRGLARFSAISCREKEGVEICNKLGFEASHVADPTLFADKSIWGLLLDKKLKAQSSKKKLVCYFMSVDIEESLPVLEEFAEKNRCRVEVLTSIPHLKPFPKSLKALLGNYCNSYPHVKMVSGYGPKEFVRAFASATWTLTDSFHAVMFSTIFNKNLRFLKPQSEFRRTMFARIEEFASKCVTGPVFVNTVQEAIESFLRKEAVSYNQLEIEHIRSFSVNWLKTAINK